VSGNCSITEIPNGIHNITVYTKDTFENIDTSDIVNFSVDVLSLSKQEPFPVVPVVAVSVTVVALVAAGLLVYHKRKTKTA
jgi:hypothetical protein